MQECGEYIRENVKLTFPLPHKYFPLSEICTQCGARIDVLRDDAIEATDWCGPWNTSFILVIRYSLQNDETPRLTKRGLGSDGRGGKKVVSIFFFLQHCLAFFVPVLWTLLDPLSSTVCFFFFYLRSRGTRTWLN